MRNYLDLLANDTFVIFLFHGLYFGAESWVSRNTSGKHLDFRLFKDLVDRLSDLGNAISIDQICQRNIPEKAFAITFDDGFESAYYLGASYLDYKRIPATFYITTGFIGNNGESWVDRVEQDLETLELSSELSVLVLKELKTRKFSKVCNLGSGGRHNQQIDNKMTWKQVVMLSKNPLFTIGGHTVNHVVLEEHRCPEIEINTCIEHIFNNSGVITKHFSYPEGKPGCDRQDIVSLLKKNGIVCSPTAQHGVNSINENLFSLKRVMVVGNLT